jgi:hypothetical protein
VSDDLAFLTDEVTALQERAKLLQEELPARKCRVQDDAAASRERSKAFFDELPVGLLGYFLGINSFAHFR